MDVYGNKFVNMIEMIAVVYFFVILGRHVNHGKPYWFGGHSSKVKVTIGIIDKCGVRGDATICVVIFKFTLINFLLIFSSQK